MKKTAMVLLFVCGIFAGCTAGSGGGDIPVQRQVAVDEASIALRSWITLLNEGNVTDFLLNVLPESTLNDPHVRTNGGGFTSKFLGKFYEVMPDLHTALQQALLMSPALKGGNLVYNFADDSAGGRIFSDGEMYLSKTGDKWHFNGPKLRK